MMQRRAGKLPPRSGFTLSELLVVLGVIVLLLALLLPALNRARAAGVRLKCASNMRQIGAAMNLYALDNSGFVPRDHSPWRPDRRPYWMIQLGTYMAPEEDWQDAGMRLTRELEVFQCPAHPLAGKIPGCFIVNAFSFRTQPNWAPAGPVQLARIQNASGVVFIGEAADLFGDDADTGGNAIYEARYHDCWRPEDLPGAAGTRLSDSRHRGTANVLLFDASVRTVRSGEMQLEWFDDGNTTPPPADPWDW